MRRGVKYFSLGAFGLLSLCLASCNMAEYTETVYAFDTSCVLNSYGGEVAYLEEASEYLSSLSNRTDTYIPREVGYAYQINKDANEGVPYKVDSLFFGIVKQSLELEKETNAYFSILSGTLSGLWKTAIETKALPDEAKIKEAVADIASSSLTLDEENLTIIRNGKAKLDFGAIAKGYGLDGAVSIMKERNVSSYLLNLGHSSVGFGEYKNGEAFQASLTDENGNRVIRLEGLKNISIGVSGATEQFAEISGTKYTHIVNPKTGEAIAQYDLVLVTSNSGAQCDAFSTAFMLMDQKDAIALAEEKGLGYLFYKKGNDLVYSLPDGIEVALL